MASIRHRRWRAGFPWECPSKALAPRMVGTRRQRRLRRWHAARRSRPEGARKRRRSESDDLFFTDVRGCAPVETLELPKRDADRAGAIGKGAGRETCSGEAKLVQEPRSKRPRRPGVDPAGEAPQAQELALADLERPPEVSSVRQLPQHENGSVPGEFANLERYLERQPLKKSGKQEFLDSLRYHAGASGSTSARHTDDGHLTKFGAKQVCVVCLQDHKAWECPQTRCFVCYETGHEVKQCPNMKLTCSRCHRSGHSSEGCIRDALMGASRRISWDEVRCVRCGEFGHPVCVENQYPPPPPRAVVPLPLGVRPLGVARAPSSLRPPPPPPPLAKERQADKQSRRKSKAKIEDPSQDQPPQEAIGRSSRAERDRCRQAGVKAAAAAAAKPPSNDGWRWHQLGEESEASEEDASRGVGRTRQRVVTADATSHSRDLRGSRRERDRADAGRSGVIDELRAKMAKQKGRNGVLNGAHSEAKGTNGRGEVDLADPSACGQSPLLQSLLALKVARGLR